MTDEQLLGRLDQRTEDMLNTLSGIDEKLGEQNGRIDQLEKWQARIVGGGVVFITMSPLFVYEIRQVIGQLLAGG